MAANVPPACRKHAWTNSRGDRGGLGPARALERDLRAQKRDVRREEALDDEGWAAAIAALYTTAMSPSQVAIGAETARRIEAAFDQLSDDHREVLTLSRIARLPRKEIAAVTGRSEDSVRNLLTRALIALSEQLDDGA